MAKRLEGKPFHIIASHCQDTSNKKDVIGYLRANDFSAHQPNMTITKNGRHPDVKGNGYVPYYVVFDHTGKLQQHHMGGSYHGGDGLAMIEWVDKLLAAAPSIYLGEAPFAKQKALASKIASGKSLNGSLRKLDTLRAGEADAETKAELARLHAAVTTYRDRELTAAMAKQTSQPGQVLSALKALKKLVNGTTLAAPVDLALETLSDSDVLKADIAIEKKFLKITRSYEKVKESKRTDVLTERTVSKLEKLIKEGEGSRFVTTVQAYLSNLR